MDFEKEYKKYRWFVTSTGSLVIGGKSAEQNEEILRNIKSSKREYFIMHTSAPGSPFSIILEEVKNVKKSDLDEAAVFTGSFSRAWRSGKKEAEIDIFLSSSLFKIKGMKEGTWGVKDRLDRIKVPLKLVLVVQKDVLRAVPPKTTGKSLLDIKPGKIDKTKMTSKIKEMLKNKFTEEEILSALPSGGVSI